jgi:hypothetical protein
MDQHQDTTITFPGTSLAQKLLHKFPKMQKLSTMVALNLVFKHDFMVVAMNL